jgi:predicted nucleotidyltransferase
LQGVPIDQVRTVFDPRKKFREMAETSARAGIESDAFAFLSLLQNEARIPPSALGITGSLLIGLYTEKSDLDAVVFGIENCNKVYRALRRMLDAAQSGELRKLNAAEKEELFTQRAADTQMNYDDFLALESRKVNQGVFRERTYFVRFVKEAQEIEEAYGCLRYTPLGRAVIAASIADDRDAIFTPCRYALSGIRILKGPQLTDLNEIVSFRGRFCEQARAGETVRACGSVERIQNRQGDIRHRLLLGNSPEDGMTVPGV